jgi:hypothetical protein
LLIRQLDLPSPQSTDATTLVDTVRTKLANRPTSLILDDICEESLRIAKTPRQCATPRSPILVSSRSPEVAAEMVGSQWQVHQLDVLEPNPAVALLREHAPEEVTADEAGAAALAEALGRLPLALKLAARLLQHDDHADRCARLLAA